ncbi:MAG TPA: signal peptide peptidase SppA [Myxococcota bacterium]|nr:signal peptide peptidase SppA [Myxococcota bacterium]
MRQLRRDERLQLAMKAGGRSDLGVFGGVRRWGARSASCCGVVRAARSGGAPRSCARRTLALCLALLAPVALSACIQVTLPVGGPSPLRESVVDGKRGPKIVMIEIDGAIRDADESGTFGIGTREGTVARVRAELELARQDDEVKALLLRINTPGGTVTASDIVFRELTRFKQERNIPIVAQLMGLATSGGYYVAMSADTIYANPTTLTGSIGVIFVSVNFAGLMEKLGVEDQTIVSGPRKDTGSVLRRMRPEERVQLQGVIEQLSSRFQDVVAQGRPSLTRERIRELADGRVYTAEEAKQAGLVDAIGYLEDGIAETKRRAGLSEARVVTYHRARESRENIYSEIATPARLTLGGPDLAASLLPPVRGPAFLYLWWPAAE